MSERAIISGFSVCLPYAENTSLLTENLRQGKRVHLSPWFTSDKQAIDCGFSGNILIAKLKRDNDSAFDLVYKLINETLIQAGLNEDSLKGDRVRVYITGIGPRVDVMDYRNFYNYNDMEDVSLISSIKKLSVENMSQDTVSYRLAKRYELKNLPPNMNCTSNSSLTAIHLGTRAIEQGGIDLALVINISKIKYQDLVFLENQGMLESEMVQPFGINSNGVIFSEGYGTMLLESQQHRLGRGKNHGISITSAYKQINAGRSNDSYWQSTSILKLINAMLNDKGIKKEDLCAFIPHGNGTSSSDNVEAKAITMYAGENALPVLAYKGQIGYTATGSGLIDLVIGHHILLNRELIFPVVNDQIIEDVAPHISLEGGVSKHTKKHLLKTGLGVDGSVVALLMTNLHNNAD
ncbi:TPA: beta-ketoacyl synthase [Klebsiella aerogenes]|nr:beta-ketoacyl synthase [Klebsiella aerogenes]HDS5322090.1 beta-ketoacyl synthase [Klebsiella aerogenes]